LLVSHALSEVDGVALADQCGADAFVQKTPQAMRRAFERLAAIDPRRAAPLAKCEVRTAYRHAFTGARVEVLPRHVVLNEVTLDLSVLELAVFAHLLRRAPDIVTVPELQRDVWKSDAIARSAVSNVIGRLVDALPSDWIERVRGGYRARVG
jgi:DNA-binding response OmpR family regulator